VIVFFTCAWRSPALKGKGELPVKYYAVAEMEITDRSWVPEYVNNVTRMVEQRGGRYLARTSKVEKVEGERKTL